MINNSDTAGTGAFERSVPADAPHRFRPEPGQEWGYRPSCRDCDHERDHELHGEHR